MGVPFDVATTARFQNNAEDEFALQSNCIVDRTALSIVAGTAIYDLPSSCINVKRVTYKGWKVFPLAHRDLRRSFQSGTQQSRPYWYIFNNIGQAQIRFFPVPSEAVSTGSGTGLWGSLILTKVIVEYYVMPDQTNYFIPTFFRSRLLTYYSNKRNFAMEGRTQDIKASKYWNDKFEVYKQNYIELLDDLNNKPRQLIANGTTRRPYGYIPPPPLLPIDRFGYSVDDYNG